ncbi:hypothetical protein D046_2939, partial [Vibrio parahaemolyticus V-223/04]
SSDQTSRSLPCNNAYRSDRTETLL